MQQKASGKIKGIFGRLVRVSRSQVFDFGTYTW